MEIRAHSPERHDDRLPAVREVDVPCYVRVCLGKYSFGRPFFSDWYSSKARESLYSRCFRERNFQAVAKLLEVALGPTLVAVAIPEASFQVHRERGVVVFVKWALCRRFNPSDDHFLKMLCKKTRELCCLAAPLHATFIICVADFPTVLQTAQSIARLPQKANPNPFAVLSVFPVVGIWDSHQTSGPSGAHVSFQPSS